MNIEQIFRKLEAIDLTDFRSREDELNVELDAINWARKTSEERTRELGAILAALKAARASGVAAADALMAGNEVSTIAVDEHAIRTEIETLALARRELVRRHEAVRAEKNRLASDLAIEVSNRIAADIEEVTQEAKRAARALVNVYGIANALKLGLRSQEAGALEEKLSPIIATLSMDGLADPSIELPADVISFLQYSEHRMAIGGVVAPSAIRGADLFRPSVATFVLSDFKRGGEIAA